MANASDVALGFFSRRNVVLHAIDQSDIKLAMDGWTKYKLLKGYLSETKIPNSVILDVVISHEMSMNSKTTSHAVEYGSDIIDHLKPDNKSLSLNAKIADMELVGFSVGGLGLDKNILEKIELLETWVKESSLVFYLGYSNDKQEIPLMAITSLKIAKPLKNGFISRDISLTLTKVEVVDSQTADIIKIKKSNPPKKTQKPEQQTDASKTKIDSTGFRL